MIWDPVRRQWVESTPEEILRQKWIQIMVQELGYPPHFLAVERDLASLASAGADPHRRIDIVCFFKAKEGLLPLLLVECKAGSIEKGAEEQALGYNDLVRAPFICLVGKEGAKTLWRELGKVASVPFLPTYNQLITTL